MDRKSFELLRAMEHSWWYDGRAATVTAALKRVGIDQGSEILDFGCGFGGMYETLARFGKRISAYEPDGEARRGAEERGYTEVFSSEDEALSHTYDLIGLFDVVEHIEDDHAFLARLNAALCDGGRLAITVPAFQFLWSVHDVHHHHFRRYTARAMRTALESAGFRVEYASYWNMTLFLPAVLTRLLGKTGEDALSPPRSIDRLFLAIVRLETLCMRILSLPFGTGLVVVARKIPTRPPFGEVGEVKNIRGPSLPAF